MARRPLLLSLHPLLLLAGAVAGKMGRPPLPPGQLSSGSLQVYAAREARGLPRQNRLGPMSNVTGLTQPEAVCLATTQRHRLARPLNEGVVVVALVRPRGCPGTGGALAWNNLLDDLNEV